MSKPTKLQFAVDDLAPMLGYKLLSSLIVPRPIGWIGSISSAGVPNLAPYSFFNAVSGQPPTVVFSPGAGQRRDTLDNVREVGEFTVNVVTAEVVEAMNATAASLPADIDEFAAVGLTSVPGVIVSAPMVGECRANLECKVTQLVPIGDPKNGNVLVIGEAVMIHVNDDVFDGNYVDQANLGAIGRHAGSTYSRADDQFSLERPA